MIPPCSYSPAVLIYLIIALIITSSPVNARECFWYTDNFGRRRRRCRGLVPGIIAAVVVGFFGKHCASLEVAFILAFLSLAFVLRRRQRRLENEAAPPTFRGATGLEEQVNNNIMSQQPPAYPPPSYPLNNLPPPPLVAELNNTTEKNDANNFPSLNITPPPPANIASHHASN
ncbi:uncharacterized protein VP01_354g5 [Puccinia sorghi]|uniref:Uncharacterized protein n=1 Tax=Puccinia sorghi TaxID=27349 RepID=A0A0L6UXC5_9BASI|nr:uncharacterized protein VP01_354g5 [Puccinia sorghi]